MERCIACKRGFCSSFHLTEFRPASQVQAWAVYEKCGEMFLKKSE
jgi:hypothetical protein